MTFDPRAHTIKLPGRKDKNGTRGPAVDYLEVKERVRWIRDEHPDADMESRVIEITEKRAIFQVRVSIPGAGAATATGNETAVAFDDYIGKAETVALGRALAILGYGINFADEFEESKEQADPKTYEVNQANPVKETADDRFDPRKRNGKANSSEPFDVGEYVLAFQDEVKAMPVLDWTAETKMDNAKQLAITLKQKGLSEPLRKAAYRALTDKESGRDLDPRELVALNHRAGQIDALKAVGEALLQQEVK